MNRPRIVTALIALGVVSLAAVSPIINVTVRQTGEISQPPNFFEANSNAINAVVHGGGGGGGAGTVTSVSATSQVAGIGFSGSPITSSGTLSITGIVGAASIDVAIARLSNVSAGYQPLDSDLTDLADGSLTGSKIGPGIDDDNVSFDDADNLWTATTIGPALEELNDSINAGAPNGAGAKVHWSQLLGVPAGFADGSDDGGGGGGSSLGIDGVTTSPVNLTSNWFGRFVLSGASNVTFVPSPARAVQGTTITPDFSQSTVHRITLTNHVSLAAPTGVTSQMIDAPMRLVFVQDSTGGWRVTNTASVYRFGSYVTEFWPATNASARSYYGLIVSATNAIDVTSESPGFQ